jgi:pimeloyl-ACP methyl ester carboxylesterase
MHYFKKYKWLLLGYLLLCGIFYYYQHLFFFQPRRLDVNHMLTFPVRIKFSEAKIPFDSATVIDVVKFEPDSGKSKGVVLFFHGNRHNVELYSTYAPYFTRNGYECWMPDYPGYGRSTGEMSVDALQQIAIQLYKMARARYQPGQIVVYGKSLGTGVAGYLAAKRDCRALVLETPYYSLDNLAGQYAFMLPVGYLMRYHLPLHQYLLEVTAPVTVVHGTRDELIPLSQAAMLANMLKPTDKMYIVPNAMHNNLPAFGTYHRAVDSLLAR